MVCDGTDQVENVFVGNEALQYSASILVTLGQHCLGKQQLYDPCQYVVVTVLPPINATLGP